MSCVQRNMCCRRCRSHHRRRGDVADHGTRYSTARGTVRSDCTHASSMRTVTASRPARRQPASHTVHSPDSSPLQAPNQLFASNSTPLVWQCPPHPTDYAPFHQAGRRGRQICGGLSLAPVRPLTAYDAGRQRRLIPIIIIIIEQAPRRPCQVVLGSLVLHRVHNILVHQGRNGRAMSSKRSVQYHHVLDLAFSVRSDAPQRGSVTPRSRGHTVHSRCLAVMHSWK
jgi:hypothetical protein